MTRLTNCVGAGVGLNGLVCQPGRSEPDTATRFANPNCRHHLERCCVEDDALVPFVVSMERNE
jgi:hypothetical protein